MKDVTPAPARRKIVDRNRPSFDVTCKIGTVYLDDDGSMSPHQAAFSLIAEHDAQGEYTFPMHNGDTCRVTVNYEIND